MLLESALTQIDQEIKTGNLASVKNKLHDLLNINPNDLQVRTKLGEVYWALNDHITAGRYWFLIEADTPEMVAATYEFVTSCKNEPTEILRRIEFNGDVGELESEFAKYMLVNLKSEAQNTGPMTLEMQTAENQANLGDLILPLNYEKRNPVKRAFLWAGCVTSLALPVVALGFAVFGVGRWVFGLF